jgi:formate-dependent phosphoribosylglycinamide formyltransferase (GAR transformylase)
MHVVLVEPGFPRNQREFVRALHAVGARVTGIGERPLEALDDETRQRLYRYERIGSVTDEGALLATVKGIQAREWVDRLEATVEAHVMAAAHVREACTIPGTSTRTAFLCRDKPAMKEVLREAGIPCAQSIGSASPDEVRDFARRVGYPLILKPRDSAGAAGTHRVTSDAELERAIVATELDRGRSIAVEEFIEGHEGFYDTLSIDGRVVHEFICHYYPNVLEAMRARWISPQVVSTNRLDAPGYEELRKLAKQVNAALGVGTTATHMEWFYGPRGLKFSEIGCRPPGVMVWDIHGACNDMDLYVEWAKAIVHGGTDVRASRRFSGGMIALRPDQDGKIVGHEGVDELYQRHGEWIIDSHFPSPGTATQSPDAGYMANAWVRMRHPDYDTLRAILDDVGRSVQVRAG